MWHRHSCLCWRSSRQLCLARSTDKSVCATSEQLQEHHIRHKSLLRVAADGLADVEAEQRAIGADRLSGDAEALEWLVVISGQLVVDQAVVVERFQTELLGEDEAVREMGQDGPV